MKHTHGRARTHPSTHAQWRAQRKDARRLVRAVAHIGACSLVGIVKHVAIRYKGARRHVGIVEDTGSHAGM